MGIRHYLTYIQTQEGFLYLTTIIDYLIERSLVGV